MHLLPFTRPYIAQKILLNVNTRLLPLEEDAAGVFGRGLARTVPPPPAATATQRLLGAAND